MTKKTPIQKKKAPVRKTVAKKKKPTAKKATPEKVFKPPSPSVRRILDSFKQNSFSIDSYFNKFGTIALTEDESAKKDQNDFYEKCMRDVGISPPKKGGKGERGENISKEQLKQFIGKVLKQPKISVQNYEILSRSSFLMLNNYFEYLITDLLAYYYNKYQSSLNERDFKITLKELNEFDSIEDAAKDLILKEIESMIIDLTFPKLLDHFKDNLQIELEEKIVDWNKIQEFRERRHLIVHNSSLVNKKYIIRTGNPYKMKIGDKVLISRDYFELAFEEFYLAGLLLSYNCWGKWDKEEADSAISNMMVESFEKLKKEKYDFSERLTEYTAKISAKNDDQENLLLRLKFNRCIALKKSNKKDQLTKELAAIKVGTALPVFKLAHCILSESYEQVEELLKQTLALNDVDMEKYLEWPIYSFIRDDKKLNDKFLDILKP